MYDARLLKLHPLWRHVAAGSLYHVLGVAKCSTNGERDGKELSVFYFSRPSGLALPRGQGVPRQSLPSSPFRPRTPREGVTP